MKNILTIFIFTTFFCLLACKDDNNVVISKDEYNKLKGVQQKEYPKPFKLLDDDLESFGDGIILGSDNHEYLITNNNLNSESVSHYIDCKECHNRNSLIQRE